MMSPAAFGITTATPLQRAIWRIADGEPLGELAGHPHVVQAIGADADIGGRPDELDIIAAIRTAKSLTAAGLSFRWSQICDVSQLGPGEVPRISVVSLSKDLADVVFGHVVGNILASPVLRSKVVGLPSSDAVILRHPAGKHVEIKVVAGSRAGASLTARWCAGAIFDEAPKMVGADEGVINYDDARTAVRGRMLPGSQIVSIGSPWAPFGPIYERAAAHWKYPTRRLVVVRAPGWLMNPVWWTRERCEELKKSDPDTYATECAAEFASPEESLFSSIEIDRATREAPLERGPEERHEYIAAIDPGTRGNAWTLVVATRKGNKKIVALAREWRGSRVEPLSPRAVFREIATILAPYEGVRGVWSDRWSGDALRDIAGEFKLQLWELPLTEVEKTQKWLLLRTKLSEGEIELPPEPMLRSDLQRVKRRTTQATVQIVLPKTSDGRHCDFAPALLGALSQWLDDVSPAPVEDGTPEAVAREVARMRKAAEQRFGRKRRPYT